MAKDIIDGFDAIKKLETGVKKLAKAVKVKVKLVSQKRHYRLYLFWCQF